MTTTTKAPAKTIFEKSYIARAQAEKAAAKEFGEAWAEGYDVVVQADVLPARYQVTAKPAPALEVPPQVAASLPVSKVAGAQALVTRARDALAAIEKVAHDVAENLTLAQALAESGETIEELKEDGLRGCGHTNCPGCGIGLDNGLLDWDSVVEQHGSKAREYQHLQWSCMACGHEWGEKRTGITIQKDRAEQNGVTRPSEGGVCSAIWAECDKRSADGTVPPIKAMKEWATAQAIDLTTCTIQYYQWRKFMGVVGRATTMPAK